MVVRSNFCRGDEDVLVSELWGSEGVRMEIVGSEGEYVGVVEVGKMIFVQTQKVKELQKEKTYLERRNSEARVASEMLRNLQASESSSSTSSQRVLSSSS